MKRKHRFIAAGAGLLLVLSSQSLPAQTFLLQTPPEEKANVGIRFMRPNFAEDSGLSTFSGTYDLYVNVPVGAKLNLVGSLPFSNVDTDRDAGESESDIGNLYIGLQARGGSSSTHRTNVSVGVFLPTAPDDNFSTFILGLLTNFYELQRSIPNTLTLYGNFAYRYHQTNGALFGLELGPQFFIPTGDDEGDVEIFAHYGLAGGFQASHVAVVAELLGLGILSEDVEDFGDRFTHAVAFGAQLTGLPVRPGIFYQIYLDKDLNEDIDGVLGIKIEVSPK
jgi:hypothetical protein